MMMSSRKAMQLAPGGGPEHIFAQVHNLFIEEDREAMYTLRKNPEVCWEDLRCFAANASLQTHLPCTKHEGAGCSDKVNCVPLTPSPSNI